MSGYLAVMTGGAVGASLRYLVSGLVYQRLGTSFPYGTLAVNVVGCFLIGLVMSVTEDRFIINQNFRLFLTVGMFGGFTTFSTYSYESLVLLRDGQGVYAMMNLAGSVVAGLAAVYVGTVAGRIV